MSCVLNRVCHFLIFKLFLREKRCEFYLFYKFYLCNLALWNFELFLYKFAAKYILLKDANCLNRFV